MKPEIKEQIDGYLFHWDSQHIAIKVSRIKMHRDGRITGEIIINTDDKDYSPMLQPPTQLNFSAERTRKELIKNLTEKFSAFDWAVIIDQLAYYVQDLARLGEPVQELWTHNGVDPPEYLLEPILFKGMPTVIFGEKGALKSTLALMLYACLILPWTDNPLGLIAPQRSIKPLILDWETESNIVQYYAKKFQTGMNLPAFPVYYRRCTLPIADDLEQIQKFQNDIKAELIIIDSLGAAAGGELKTPEVALKFFSALRRLKTTGLILAQTSKDEETKRKSIYGSTFFTYYSRSIWEACKAEAITDDEVDVALFHRWSNLTKLQKPLGFRLYFNETEIKVENTPVDITEFRARISTQTRILEELKEGLLEVDELANRTGSTTNTVRVILTRLKKREKVVNPEKGKWGLSYQGEL